ncbi:MAG: hypothetical protein JXA11_04060 [Phycisphaerae bacterium]|nr:hypothetical protein [Phycisphaerae bacterium]
MNPQNPEVISPPDINPGNVSPNLKGPTIFVYVISTLAGLAAGAIIAEISWSEDTYYDWPDIMGYVGLFAGVLGGFIAARFWTKQISRLVLRNEGSIKKMIVGTLLGVIAGWIGAAVLWLFEGIFYFVFGNMHDFMFIAMGSFVGIAYCGSIGGAGVGIIGGGVWAIWTRRLQR